MTFLSGGLAQRLRHRPCCIEGSMLTDFSEQEELDLLRLQPVTGGESRTGQLTGTKALMLAVLEDGIRCYLGASRILAQEAEFWIFHAPRRRQSPFLFSVVCEV